MLSGPERRALDAIEKFMLDEDPDLCRALRMGESIAMRRWKLAACLGGVSLGAVLVVTGVLMLSLGLVIVGCVLGSMGVLAFVRVRNEGPNARPHNHPDPGGDISPTWWSAA
jgi:hypothetical protein